MSFLMAQGVPVMICYCVREGCCHGQAARVYTRPAGHFVVLLKRLFFGRTITVWLDLARCCIDKALKISNAISWIRLERLLVVHMKWTHTCRTCWALLFVINCILFYFFFSPSILLWRGSVNEIAWSAGQPRRMHQCQGPLLPWQRRLNELIVCLRSELGEKPLTCAECGRLTGVPPR